MHMIRFELLCLPSTNALLPTEQAPAINRKLNFTARVTSLHQSKSAKLHSKSAEISVWFQETFCFHFLKCHHIFTLFPFLKKIVQKIVKTGKKIKLFLLFTVQTFKINKTKCKIKQHFCNSKCKQKLKIKKKTFGCGIF